MLVFLSGLVLFFDVGGELHMAVQNPASLSGFVWGHLVLEVAASLALGAAFILLRQDRRRALAARDTQSDRLNTLRTEFDSFLHARFAQWALSPAEVDIALLTIRGLKISEIADLRDTREGTIKSQLSSIFRKSGVHTRTAFVAQFMDEFLDIAANDTA